MPPGRTPSWPKPWLDLAAKCGGSVELRVALGYRSKTTLSDKLRARSPWTRSDFLLLSAVAERHHVAISTLLPAPAILVLSKPDGRPVLADASEVEP